MTEKCTNNEHSCLTVGDFTFRNRAFLAPMSGVSDVPFRQLAWQLGAGMVVSEMVASQALTTGQQEMQLKAESAGLPVHIVQLAGREAKWMGLATQLAEDAGASIIDINMGCPARRVTNGYSGSALMRDLDHAMTLIEAVRAATDLPVTLKMRLGWDEHTINAPQLALRAEAAGVQMITVHGRTRNQFYKGKADWSKVADVRANISVPLIVNGDISSADEAKQALALSGADGVMIGRASYGAPWKVGQIGAALNNETIVEMPQGPALAALILSHYEAILSYYGAEIGVRTARKHLGWYCDHIQTCDESLVLKRMMMTSFEPCVVMQHIQNLFSNSVIKQKVAA